MTHFEYLTIAFGLVFTLTAMRLIGGLPYALQPGRRYWVHVTMTVMIMVAGAATFWNFWSLQEVQWTFHRFVLALSIPGLLYFNAATIIPENPEDIASWREHYQIVRVRFFLGLALWAVAAAYSATVNLGAPWDHPSRPFHAAVVAMGIIGATISHPRAHAALAIAMTIIGLAMMFSVAAPAGGWLGR